MPLTWDATKVNGWDEFDDMDSSIMGNYCFILMAVGIGEVKADNVGEIVFRTRMLQGLNGNMLHGKTPEVSAEIAKKLGSAEFVSRLIGFHANVGDEAWTNWSRRVHNIHAGEYQGYARRALEAVSA
jgi:hypothetical protein